MIIWILTAVAIAGLAFAIYWKITAPAKPSALSDIDKARKSKVTGQAIDQGAGAIKIKNTKNTLKYLGELTAEEVSKHKTRDDCWIIVDGEVYDVTDYIDTHPGGDAIMNNAGADSSVAFHGPQHPSTVKNVLPDYRIGVLATKPKTL